MPLRWKLNEDTNIPQPVECSQIGHPYVDAEGDTQYDNTHFDDEDTAWRRGHDEILARLSLIGGDVRRAREELARVQRDAADAAVVLEEFLKARRRRKRERERAS